MRVSSHLRHELEHRGDGARERLDVVLVGPYPPPLGGVAAHLVRVVDVLQRAGLDVGVVNHFGSRDGDVVIAALGRNPLRCFFETRRLQAGVVHYHHSRWSMLLAFALSQRRSRSRLLITIHGLVAARRLKLRVPMVRRITRWALARFDRIIVVNREIEAYLREHVESDRIVVIPAFVPPSDHDATEYQPDIAAFFAGGKVMLASAYRVHPLKSGGDLYGLDLAVDAFVALAPERPELKLAVLLARPPLRRSERLFLGNLRRRVERAGFGSRVLWATGLPLLPALRHDVVLVRPTREDGDSVSVREALDAGVPVAASDVVARPAGVVTFASGSADDLRSEVDVALFTPRDRKPSRSPAADSGNGFVDELLALYGEYLDRLPVESEAART